MLPPSKPGFYWWRDVTEPENAEWRVAHVYLFRGEKYLVGNVHHDQCEWYVKDMGGEWGGPALDPEQFAELVRSVRTILEYRPTLLPALPRGSSERVRVAAAMDALDDMLPFEENAE